jgi:hypothetical protein
MRSGCVFSKLPPSGERRPFPVALMMGCRASSEPFDATLPFLQKEDRSVTLAAPPLRWALNHQHLTQFHKFLRKERPNYRILIGRSWLHCANDAGRRQSRTRGTAGQWVQSKILAIVSRCWKDSHLHHGTEPVCWMLFDEANSDRTLFHQE